MRQKVSSDEVKLSLSEIGEQAIKKKIKKKNTTSIKNIVWLFK